MKTYTKDELIVANSLINLYNSTYFNDQLYNENKEIRNYNRTRIAIEISNYLKLNNTKYNYYFFEKLINAFKYFQKNNKENHPRIPPDFLSILWQILKKQEELYGLIINSNIVIIMDHAFVDLNKTNDEIEIENKLLNLFK
jgi:hypothetical protein